MYHNTKNNSGKKALLSSSFLRDEWKYHNIALPAVAISTYSIIITLSAVAICAYSPEVESPCRQRMHSLKSVLWYIYYIQSL